MPTTPKNLSYSAVLGFDFSPRRWKYYEILLNRWRIDTLKLFFMDIFRSCTLALYAKKTYSPLLVNGPLRANRCCEITAFKIWNDLGIGQEHFVILAKSWKLLIYFLGGRAVNQFNLWICPYCYWDIRWNHGVSPYLPQWPRLVDHIVLGAAKDAFVEADAWALAKAGKLREHIIVHYSPLISQRSELAVLMFGFP